MKLICSDDERLIDDYLVNAFASQQHYQTVRYESVEQLTNFLSQRSLFRNETKTVIKNCTFICAKKKTPFQDETLVSLAKVLIRFVKDDLYLTTSDFDLKSVPTELGGFIDKVETIHIPKLSGKVMIKKYIKKYAKTLSFKIDDKTLNYLAGVLVPDAGIIVNEINKLFLASHHGKDLAEAKNLVLDYHILDYSGKNIFRLLNEIIDGNCHGSIAMYDQLMAEQYSPAALLQIMMAQLFKLKNACRLIQSGSNLETVRQALALPSYFFAVNQSVFNPHFLKKFIKMFNRMCELDIEWKSGSLEPTQCLRANIVWFCGLFSQV